MKNISHIQARALIRGLFIHSCLPHYSSLRFNFSLVPVRLRRITHPYGKKRMDSFFLCRQKEKLEEASICNIR